MQKITLVPPPGYDSRIAPVVGTTAAELDLLLASLAKRVKDAPVELLEWQLQPGVNTIGMLLAHIAIVEVYWVEVAERGLTSLEEVDRVVQAILGIRMDDDGLPLPADGVHPRVLAGKTATDYLGMLQQARSATHRTLLGWKDSDLEETRQVEGQEVSRAWVLYHLVEHFAHHRGQIALLVSLHRRFQSA
ncbi:MAG TPA: DinB family protein [Thermoanaerobaculia bacterium]|nr:DinB family protein [Thermoanaerobaculia bacterium]